ncbi:S8 family serine peptidase [Thiohalomonas denitrificans]|uniref:GlyGly-CTERM domain-containing protein n=1 Tax=Thiohalomonas denitrificans TaxID=415747 RepID=A0A1G5PZT9_9GAMM|nr:S8 family serine peptidase [Thiohalomonas denitrificans]SCZ54912.1 GlyGly-CTERM domain-containing protein [Thiohalomonas denitrificans]
MITRSTLILIAGLWFAPFASAASGSPTKAEQPLPYRPGELLVKFQPGTDARARALAMAPVNGKRAQTFRRFGVEKWTLPDNTDVATSVRQLQASRQVVYAEPNFIHQPHEVFPDELDERQWGLYNTGKSLSSGSIDPTDGLPGADMDLPRAWDLQTHADSVVIAVIDNGILLSHPDLEANLIPGWDFAADDADPTAGPDEIHGTLVAGTAGARGSNGTGITSPAQRVQIMPLRTNYSVAQLIAAYQYAADNGAHIINASYGGAYSQAEFDAIEQLEKEGILFLAAAGNGGYSNDAIPNAPSGYDLPNVLSVASSHPQDGLSVFTQIGPRSVDLAAPGSSIYTTSWTRNEQGDRVATYQFAEGTSFSAPYTAAVAALVKAERESQGENPLDYREMKGRLLAGVDPITNGKLATDGRANAHGAMTISPRPVLVIADWHIDDAAGNSNGELDPAESATLRVKLSNQWHDAAVVTGILRSLAPDLIVVDDSDSLASPLSQGAEAELAFTVRMAGGARAHQHLPLELSLSDGDYEVTRRFALEFGSLAPEEGKLTLDERIRESSHWDQVHGFHFEVPEGARNLTVTTTSTASGAEVDLLVRHGARPEPQFCYWYTPLPPNCMDKDTLRSVGSTSDEAITIAEPSPGIYYASVILFIPTEKVGYVPSEMPYTLSVRFDPPSGDGGGGAMLWLIAALLPGLTVRRRIRGKVRKAIA